MTLPADRGPRKAAAHRFTPGASEATYSLHLPIPKAESAEAATDSRMDRKLLPAVFLTTSPAEPLLASKAASLQWQLVLEWCESLARQPCCNGSWCLNGVSPPPDLGEG